MEISIIPFILHSTISKLTSLLSISNYISKKLKESVLRACYKIKISNEKRLHLYL